MGEARATPMGMLTSTTASPPQTASARRARELRVAVAGTA